MSVYKQVAIDAALTAGSYIHEAAASINELEIRQKSLNDYVSEVDRYSETLITSAISESFPSHSILGEEYGQQGGSDLKFQWIIDPLDGTTNFLRSIPHYAVSIALACDGVIELGVIYDPCKKELFCAEKGKGVFLNKQKISTSSQDNIKGALLATGIPFSGENLAKISSFTSSMQGLLALQTSGIRRLGAAALDLAYVAAGRYEGFWESGLKSWDIAAGALLVTEAGGVVSDLHGGEAFLQTGNILAANEAVHNSMLKITKRCYSPV